MAITYFPPIPVNIKWGDIGGDLANQTDISNALNSKADVSHTHPTDDVDGLDTALAGKADTSHTHEGDDLAVASPAGDYLKDDGTWDMPDPLPQYPDATNNCVLRFDTSASPVGWYASDRISVPDDDDPNDPVRVDSNFIVKDPSGQELAKFQGSIIFRPNTVGDGVFIHPESAATGKSLTVYARNDGTAVKGIAYTAGTGGDFTSDSGTCIAAWTGGTADFLSFRNGSTQKVTLNSSGHLYLNALGGSGNLNVQVDNSGKIHTVPKSSAVSDHSDTSGTDADGTARAKINEILAALRTHNLIST
jgi:hypothetical protein